MRINKVFDSKALFPEKIMYLIKSLRNSIAHNDIVFDVRFKDNNIANSLCKFLSNETGCANINFNTVTDYVIIIVFLLESYGINKTDLNKFVNDYEKIIEDFRNNISVNIYNQIIYTDTKNKLLI